MNRSSENNREEPGIYLCPDLNGSRRDPNVLYNLKFDFGPHKERFNPSPIQDEVTTLKFWIRLKTKGQESESLVSA